MKLNGLKKAGLAILGVVLVTSLTAIVLTAWTHSVTPLFVALGVGTCGLVAAIILAVIDISQEQE